MVREVPIRREWEKRIDQDIYQKSGWNMLHISLHTAADPVLKTVDQEAKFEDIFTVWMFGLFSQFGNMGCWSFQTGETALKGFLTKNQHIQRK